MQSWTSPQFRRSGLFMGRSHSLRLARCLVSHKHRFLSFSHGGLGFMPVRNESHMITSLLEEAKQAMLDLAELTEGIARGAPPDVHSILGYQARLVRFHALLGEEMARKFGGKERA